MRKLTSRLLVFMTALIMLIACLPLGNLIAHANNSSGDGKVEGETVDSGSYSIWQQNTGVRLYLVDASGGPNNLKVVPFTYNGNQYSLLDIWDPNYKSASSSNFLYRYGVRVGSDSQSLKTLTITYNTLKAAGLSSPDYVSEAGPWVVDGSFFHDWMTSKSPEREATNMANIMLAFMAGGKADTYKKFTKNYYLIAEPLVCMPAYHDNQFTNAGYRGTVVGTWYDYMRFNQGSNGGWSAAKARSFANGFKLGVDSEDQAYKNFVNKTIKDNLGLDTPPHYEGGYTDEAHTEGKYFGGPDGRHTFDYFSYIENTGWGIQIYWDGEPPQSGKPIDSYDITSSPQPQNVPTPPETPSDENQTSGEKTIIKLYADLYKDPTTELYTHIENIKSADPNHPYAFVKTDVSNEISITNEEPINGYKVSAWYVSKTAYDSTNKTNNAMLKATNMINVADLSGNKTDGKVSLTNLGGKQLRINNYQAAYKSSGKAGYNSYEGCQKFLASLPDKHGPTGTGTTAISFMNAKQYYTYKRLETKGTSNYGTYNYPVTENDDVVTLGEEDETIVILYTRERTYVSTADLTESSEIPDTPDDRIDQSGNLSIVKLYGILNPNTYEIVPDPSKSTVIVNNATRNVNIKNESGYNFAEWVYITGGVGTSITASQMGNPNLGTFKLDGTADQAYRLDGFVDGFKNNSTLEQYFRFSNGTSLSLPTICIIPGSDNVNSNTVTGRYSYGSRSGIGTGSYNSTLYLGGDKLSDNTPDDTDQNDVLYLLFLKTDQLSYSADDLVIPESYISRFDDYKHHPMTVTGSVSGKTYSELLQAHKFKYVLPVVTGAEYKDINPLFIPHIALTNKTQSGLITNASSVQRLQLNTDLSHEVIKAYTNPEHSGLSDYAQLIYLDQGYAITSSASSGKKYVGSMLNVNALNLEYTAYRQGDKVTPAIWKYNKLSTLTSSTSPLSITDTKKPLADIAVSNINTAISPLTSSGAISLTQSSRKPNDSSQNFTLDFTFSEVGDGIKSVYLTTNKACRIYTITDLHGIDQPKKITINGTTLNLFKTDSTYSFSAYRYLDNNTRVLAKAECSAISDPQFSDYAIHSLNRLYQIKQSDGSYKYAKGVTRYLNTVSDVSITQNVQYNVHYGSPKSNPYKDKTESGSGTDTTRGQYGYVRSMKASNTITFYPYHVMQYELPESYNATLNKDGTLKSDLEIKSSSLGNNANQLYIMGEEARSLNIYDYAEVSYYGHAVSSSKGVDVVNNIINSNRKGRIEISSEQWSTHARASSLIGLCF